MPKKKEIENPLRHRTTTGFLLTEKETAFVRNMVLDGKSRMDSLIDAYGYDSEDKKARRLASSMASENLSKPHIREAMTEIYESIRLTDEDVDRELDYVINQKGDLSPKVRAINEYNKVKGRHAAEKHEHKFKGVTDEELKERLAEEIARNVGTDGGDKEERDRGLV